MSSALAKIERAKEHSELLINLVSDWFKSGAISLTKETNAEATRICARIHILEKPPLGYWGLIFSDAVHNLRCALDHCVYEIAARYHDPIPPDFVRRSAFPICDSPANFSAQFRRIDLLPEDIQRKIKSFQLYNRKHTECPPLLAMLRDFNDIDKHRLPVLTIAKMQSGGFTFDPPVAAPKGVPINFWQNYDDLEDGAELGAVTFQHPQASLKYEYRADLGIYVNHDPGPTGVRRSGTDRILRFLREEVQSTILTL
jgi:hypothetical protein